MLVKENVGIPMKKVLWYLFAMIYVRQTRVYWFTVKVSCQNIVFTEKQKMLIFDERENFVIKTNKGRPNKKA